MIKVIIGLLAIAITMIMAIWYKAIVLIIIKMIYGQYSRQYVSKYRKYFQNNPFPHALIGDLEESFYFIKKLQKKNGRKTIINITFDGLELGQEIKNFVKQKGEPHYFSIKMIDSFSVEIYAYNSMLFGRKVIIKFFIHQDQLIMGELIYDSPSIEEIDVFSVIFDKYCSEDTSWDGKLDLLYDDTDTFIYRYDNGFKVSIKYFILNSDSKIKSFLFQNTNKLKDIQETIIEI